MQSPFHRPTRFEEIYRREIQKLFDRYFTLPTTELLGEITMRLAEFAHGKSFLDRWATTLASRMVTQVKVNNARNWRQAASQASKGRVIYQMLQSELAGPLNARIDQLVKENAGYIKSVPANVAEMLTKHIQTQQIAGLRSEQIIKQIKPKLKQLRHYEIARLARTEVAKADTAITRVRAENIGLNWYQWETSEDARVRDSHKLMDQVLINWNDAPSPEQLDGLKSVGHYHAGNIYNCRCVALPIVSLDELSFPVKVYTQGQIRRLTRKQFSLISNVGYELAA